MLRLLRERHARHPAAGWVGCRSSPDGPTCWTGAEARQILDCINVVIYDRMELADLPGRFGGALSRLCDRVSAARRSTRSGSGGWPRDGPLRW